jgi:MEDS: MEthanogen/methylotroph, DcmR Sensory domain
MQPPSGLSPVPPQFPLSGHPEHHVQFYSDDDFLVDGIETFLRGAVENGDGAICVASKKHLAALAVRFKARDQGMTAATEQGRYLSLDVADLLSAVMAEGKLNEARTSEFFGNAITKTTAAIERGKPRIVVFGEAVAVLWAEGKFDDVLRLERLGNDLARANTVSVRCAYPIRAFSHPRDKEYFQLICGEHSTVIAPEDYAPPTAEPDQMQAAIPSVQWLAQERQLVERDAALNYPEWQRPYRAAVLETDRGRLFKKVKVAEAAVLTRLHALQCETDHHVERHQLMRAWRVLHLIKKEKLGFFE